MPLRIEDYALIGDCESAALVGRDGSIDWLCWPRFDSDACFAALLGAREHGRFQIAPRDGITKVTRRYRPGTLILETHFETQNGAVTLVDFMPMHGRNPDCVRIVVGERGRVAMGVEMVLRFGYGEIIPWVRKLGNGVLRAIAGPDMVVLRTPVHMRGENMTTVGEFTVGEGDRVPFVLSYGPSHLPVPEAFAADAALKDTQEFWDAWTAKGHVSDGPWAEAVCRSLITLKALTYEPTGGIVAAPTTSLPEFIGGNRNWDYRYCWVRDATLTLLALMNAGYYDEAQRWSNWLTRAVAGRPEQMDVMYGVAGERRLTEWEAPWLPGYEDSSPVRIGNAAHSQLQLDVFGEVMDTLHQSVRPRDQERRDVRPARQGRALARTLRGNPRRCLRQGLGSGAQQLHALVRLDGSRCEPAAAGADRIYQTRRSTLSRHRRGGRKVSHRRWPGDALRYAPRAGRIAGRRRRFPAVQLLACGCVSFDRAAPRGRKAVRTPRRAV
jgi:GH15 family glucan-1,4-alpha-glucosidase